MIEKPERAAIIGCGAIGHRRANNLSGACLVACADVVEARARALAAPIPGCRAFSDWRELLDHNDLDVVVVATPHDSLAEIAAACALAGHHVLVEKPAGRTVDEIELIAAAANRSGALVRVGFNHRYHRALQRTRALVDEGALGKLMYVRARYGHGGRVGYDREWRADPKISGGGELIDQGPHVIDLARWFLGDFQTIQRVADTFYWDMPVDDNAFLILRTADRKTAFLHVSCSEWKNIFSFELYGTHGKISVSGLGGSYGLERVAFYRMLPEMGPPETTIWEYPMMDNSWGVEFTEFLEDIRLKRQPSAGLADASAVLRVIETVYQGDSAQGLRI